MNKSEYFDVLTVKNEDGYAEIVHSFFAEECLGSNMEQETTKLYFTGGQKEDIESKLYTLPNALQSQWHWEVQPKEDWHLSWKENFHAVLIENEIAIVPYWESSTTAQTVIKIKPGMAFGTGHHETTWLILNKMNRILKPGMSVLDLGTGSGILAITAHKLGADHIDAVEYDAECEQNFKENLELNQLDDAIPFHFGDVLKWKNFEYDLITANINRNILQQLLPLLYGSPALILLSGLLLEDLKFMEKLCIKNNLKIIHTEEKGEWLALEVQTR